MKARKIKTKDNKRLHIELIPENDSEETILACLAVSWMDEELKEKENGKPSSSGKD